jgi:hypothetical protein
MDAGDDMRLTGSAAVAATTLTTSADDVTSQGATIFDVLRDRGFDFDRATVRDSKQHIRQWTTRRLKAIGNLFTATTKELEANGAFNAAQLLTSVWSKVLLNFRKPRSFLAFGLQPIKEGGRLRKKPHPLPAGIPTSEEVRVVVSFLENPKFAETIVVPSPGQLLEVDANVHAAEQEAAEDQTVRFEGYAEDSDSDSDEDLAYTPTRPTKDTQARKQSGVVRSLRRKMQLSYADCDTDDELPEQQPPAKRSKMQIKLSHQAQAQAQTQAAAAQPEPTALFMAAAQPPTATQPVATTSSCIVPMRSQDTAEPEHDAVRPEMAVHAVQAVRPEAARRQVAPPLFPMQHAAPAEPDQESLPVLGFGDKYARGYDAPRQHAIATWALALRSLPKSGPSELKLRTVVSSLGFGYVEDAKYVACKPLEPESSVHLGPFQGLQPPTVTAAEAGVPAQDEKTEVVFCAMAVPYAYKSDFKVYFGAVPMVLYLEERSKKIYLALPSHMADEAAMQRMEVRLEAHQDPTSLDEWRQMAWPSVRRHAADNMLRLSHSQHDGQAGAMNGAEPADRFLPVSMDVSPLDLMAGYLQMNMSGGPMQRLRPDRPTPHEAAKTLIKDGLRLLYSNHFDPHVRDRISSSPFRKLPPALAAPEQDRVHVYLAAKGSSPRVLHALACE